METTLELLQWTVDLVQASVAAIQGQSYELLPLAFQ